MVIFLKMVLHLEQMTHWQTVIIEGLSRLTLMIMGLTLILYGVALLLMLLTWLIDWYRQYRLRK